MPDTLQNAAIAGSYSDLRFIKGRKVAQITIEIPIEQADHFLEMFGAPRPDAEIPVALARLALPAGPAVPAPASVIPSASTGEGQRESDARRIDAAERGRETYRQADEMQRAVTRAALLCDDRRFQLWASTQLGSDGATDATDWLRKRLHIASRKEIAGNERAYRAFLAIEASFKAATGQLAEMRG